MKTKSLLFTSVFIFQVLASYVYAQQVTYLEAKQVAKNFFYERINGIKQVSYESVKIIDEYLAYQEGPIYFFNFEEGGFVAVSSLHNTIPVLVYSFNGYYDPVGQPPQLEAYLQIRAKQIGEIASIGMVTYPQIDQQWDRLLSKDKGKLHLYDGRSIEPLLFSTWNQDIYYNEMCPADPAGPGGHCYAGCVATAMGQVMNYFRWPLQGEGSYSYECPPYGTLSVNFGESDYTWNGMPLDVNTSNPPVAEVLYHLGVSVDMVYGPNGSGMYNHKAAYTLQTYFRYAPQTVYVYRDSTSMDWDSLLIAHLNRKMPMYYAGWSVPNINGHAFVCDGYQDVGYYHFNWGWSGSYDGYFYTDQLNPGGSNFNLAQEVIINAFPDTINNTYPYYCASADTLTEYAGTIGDGSGPVYPYDNNQDCSWLIFPFDSVNSITLEFLSFQTAENDILTVYDGPNTSSPVLGVYSGNEIPDDITSTGDQLLITFQTNSTIDGEGWLISYHSDIPVYCSGMTNLTAIADTFSDGSGPRNYHNQTTCLWNIHPEGASEITLSFIEFNTEQDLDVLKVYDGTSLLAELSGDELPGAYTATSGSMFLTWSTNATVTAPGWKACYTTNLVGKEETTSPDDIKVIPNPTFGNIFLILKKPLDISIIRMYALDGQEIIRKIVQTAQNTIQVDLAGLDPGLYIMGIQTQDEIIYRKVVKK